VLPFIEGDGTGPDIWRATRRVLDAAVARAYGGARRIAWLEVLAGEKAFNATGEWLPPATLAAFRQHLVGIKGPLTTPVGGGIRSLNVALRQELDLYVCLRPVRYFQGVPSPVKRPELVDVVIFRRAPPLLSLSASSPPRLFVGRCKRPAQPLNHLCDRENTEDIYAGIEFQQGTPDALAFAASLQAWPQRYSKIRFPETSGYGVKPVSREGSQRLVEAALKFALEHKRKSLTLVHKGNIMKFTEGAFRDWGYALARSPQFRAHTVTERESWILSNAERDASASVEDNARSLEPGYATMTAAQQAKVCSEVQDVLRSLQPTHGGGRHKSLLLVKDAIADIALQQVLTRPSEFDVVATLNLNGDYLSDALAAQVGGIGIAPGGNINYRSGHALFEATHGTAPKYAGQDKVNPGSSASCCARVRARIALRWLRSDSVGRAHAALPGLGGGCGSGDQGAGRRHPEAGGDLRLPPPDGAGGAPGEAAQVLPVRRGDCGQLLVSGTFVRQQAGAVDATPPERAERGVSASLFDSKIDRFSVISLALTRVKQALKRRDSESCSADNHQRRRRCTALRAAPCGARRRRRRRGCSPPVAAARQRSLSLRSRCSPSTRKRCRGVVSSIGLMESAFSTTRTRLPWRLNMACLARLTTKASILTRTPWGRASTAAL